MPVAYAGAAACDCHGEVAELSAKGRHKAISCESCHGPLSPHVADPTVAVAKIADLRFCVRCHEASPSRPDKFPQVNVTEHTGQKNCMECHKPHQPKAEKTLKEPSKGQTPGGAT